MNHQLRQMQSRSKLIAEINVVPYIDVMLVLLVILMVTTPLLMQGVEVELPRTSAKAIQTQTALPLIVTVDKNGALFLNTATDKPLMAKDLMYRVASELMLDRKMKRQRLVLVKGDRKVPYDYVVRAMTLLQKSGVHQIGLMTERTHETI